MILFADMLFNFVKQPSRFLQQVLLAPKDKRIPLAYGLVTEGRKKKKKAISTWLTS